MIRRVRHELQASTHRGQASALSDRGLVERFQGRSRLVAEGRRRRHINARCRDALPPHALPGYAIGSTSHGPTHARPAHQAVASSIVVAASPPPANGCARVGEAASHGAPGLSMCRRLCRPVVPPSASYQRRANTPSGSQSARTASIRVCVAASHAFTLVVSQIMFTFAVGIIHGAKASIASFAASGASTA